MAAPTTVIMSVDDMSRRARRALRLFGWDVPDCLPGEPGACGADAGDHLASYLGGLQAACEYILEQGHPPARALVDLWRREFLEEMRGD